MQFLSRNLWLPLALLLALFCARWAIADEAPLFEQEPFDTIKLDDENKNVVLKVQPLDLPNRIVPTKPKPDDELEIHLLERPRKAYKLTWEHIAEVKLFERMVLDDAEQLTAGGKFDEAYPYFEFLERRYPKMVDLPVAYEKYLLANAGAAYKHERYEESLAVLWELFDRNPEHKGVSTAIQRVVGKLFDRWMAEGNYSAARGILREASARLKEQARAVVDDGNQRLRKLAADRLATAKIDFQAGRYAAARHDCREALAAWPEVEGGTALAAMMQAKYPLVEVGLTATAEGGDAWAIERTTRLLTRSIAELTQFTGESATYSTPLLKSIDASDRRLLLSVKQAIHWPAGSALTGADVARALLAEADPRSPSYQPPWAKRVASISLPAIDRLEIELQSPFRSFEAMLAVPLWRNDGAPGGRSGLGPYRIVSATPRESRYLAVEDYFAANKNQPKEILQRLYPSMDAALAALRKGDVQVVDRVGPFDAESLKNSAALAVEPYAAPTVHLLVFNRRRPMMNNAMFRRAIAHALDRQTILGGTLSHGAAMAGGKVADTLLAPVASDGSSAASLRYDPATAKVLMQVASAEGRPSPGLPASLTLEYPGDEAARTACTAIQRQFHAVGLTLNLRQQSLARRATRAEPSDADLFYVEWRPLEPASSLARLLGPGGPGGGSDVAELFSELESAATAEQQAIKRSDIDATILGQTLLIPLWQLTDYVAYRRELRGIGRQPITLYQNVEQWRLGSDGE